MPRQREIFQLSTHLLTNTLLPRRLSLSRLQFEASTRFSWRELKERNKRSHRRRDDASWIFTVTTRRSDANTPTQSQGWGGGRETAAGIHNGAPESGGNIRQINTKYPHQVRQNVRLLKKKCISLRKRVSSINQNVFHYPRRRIGATVGKKREGG